jgi:hypothetical protein
MSQWLAATDRHERRARREFPVRRRITIAKWCYTIGSCTNTIFWQNEAKLCSSFNVRHKGWGRLEAARHHHARPSTPRSTRKSLTKRLKPSDGVLPELRELDRYERRAAALNGLRKSANASNIASNSLVNGATPAQNAALASVGAEFRLANGVTLLGKFDGEFASHSSSYAGTERHIPRPRGAPVSSDPPRNEEISHRNDARRKPLTDSAVRDCGHTTHANALCCRGRLSDVTLTTTPCFHGPEHGLFQMIWKSFG